MLAMRQKSIFNEKMLQFFVHHVYDANINRSAKLKALTYL